jgi:hypothetical protein
VTPDEFRRAQDQALADGGAVPVGRLVLCDIDSTDLTDDPRGGGYMFGSYAVGPCCATSHEARVRDGGETWNIRSRCPEGVSFADWVRALRGPDAAFTVTKLRGGAS